MCKRKSRQEAWWSCLGACGGRFAVSAEFWKSMQTSFGLLLRGRQQGPPRFPEEGKECVRVA